MRLQQHVIVIFVAQALLVASLSVYFSECRSELRPLDVDLTDIRGGQDTPPIPPDPDCLMLIGNECGGELDYSCGNNPCEIAGAICPHSFLNDHNLTNSFHMAFDPDLTNNSFGRDQWHVESTDVCEEDCPCDPCMEIFPGRLLCPNQLEPVGCETLSYRTQEGLHGDACWSPDYYSVDNAAQPIPKTIASFLPINSATF